MPPIENNPNDDLTSLLVEEPSIKDDQIERLQTQLNDERDARLEERFVCIVILVILLDIVFFSIMQNFGCPIALLILELLILIPISRRIVMEAIATILDRIFDRVAGHPKDKN